MVLALRVLYHYASTGQLAIELSTFIFASLAEASKTISEKPEVPPGQIP